MPMQKRAKEFGEVVSFDWCGTLSFPEGESALSSPNAAVIYDEGTGALGAYEFKTMKA